MKTLSPTVPAGAAGPGCSLDHQPPSFKTFIMLRHAVLLACTGALLSGPAAADPIIHEEFSSWSSSNVSRSTEAELFSTDVVRSRRHHHHHRVWNSDNNDWAIPLAIGGLWLGYEVLKDNEAAREHTPPAAPQYAPSEPKQHIWYWCESEQAYYPTVRACPFGWTEVPGASATVPPAPPSIR